MPLSLALLVCSGGCASGARPAALHPLRSPPSRYTTPLPGPIHTIVLDAGHGGHDGGASYYGLKEKDLALDLARRLRQALEADGFTVVMTRETDHFLPLSGRPAVANGLPADVFVSVHLNAHRNHDVSGAEVYYPQLSVVSPNAQWPPFVLPTEVSGATVTVKQILWDLVLGRTRAQSHRLASRVCSALSDGLQVPCRRKPARFVILREAWMPAVLVEVGYVSNGTEARRLSDPAYRQTAAESIAHGIVSYVRDLGTQHI